MWSFGGFVERGSWVRHCVFASNPVSSLRPFPLTPVFRSAFAFLPPIAEIVIAFIEFQEAVNYLMRFDPAANKVLCCWRCLVVASRCQLRCFRVGLLRIFVCLPET